MIFHIINNKEMNPKILLKQFELCAIRCFFFLPLFTERAAKGDVVFHCSIEQPGLLGSVGHRVSVLAGCSRGNRGKQIPGENYKSWIHKASKRRSTDPLLG